jgi:uncharacterized membrane protein
VNKTRQIAEVATFAALYAALTWVFAPISYQVFQFRIAECLKSIVGSRKHLIMAFVVGNALSNMFSPFIGIWELLWMPFINLVGASTAWFFGKLQPGMKGVVLGGTAYAIWVAFGVSFMFHILFDLPLPLMFAYVLIPELLLIVGFSPAMSKVNTILSARFP